MLFLVLLGKGALCLEHLATPLARFGHQALTVGDDSPVSSGGARKALQEGGVFRDHAIHDPLEVLNALDRVVIGARWGAMRRTNARHDSSAALWGGRARS
jgi:hypothetical protein